MGSSLVRPAGTSVEATATSAGAMPASLFGATQYSVEAVSPLLDMTTGGTLVSFTAPVKRAGYYFVAGTSSIIGIGAYAGTATTGLIISVGNDVAQANAISTSQGTISTNTLNVVAPFAPFSLITTTGPASAILVDGATEVTIKWVAPAGVTTGHFKVLLRGTWVATT